ncbi:MAG: tRNA 5'-guanylyltransferase [Phycisphaerae bacterium]|nr:tRNA 5'-guanylyltransferase [Phycisphaerae bacterium]
MKFGELDSKMRQLEWFHGLRALTGTWPILRVDGRSFSRLTAASFDKPFDARFHELMTLTATALLEALHGVYAYTESDEISVLLPSDSGIFDRELEKLVSVSAGVASATFTHAFARESVHFDSRLCLAATPSLVIDYFRWRQSDAARCALNGHCYWALRKEGHSVAAATRSLEGMTNSEKNELLFQRGTNFNETPLWQRRGTGVYWRNVEKQGFNPQTGEGVTTSRRRPFVDRELPVGDSYGAFIEQFVRPEAARLGKSS